MSGLDRIIDAISADAEKEAERITAEARREAERITAAAKESAEAAAAGGSADAETEYKRIIARAKSAGEVAASRIVLGEKQRIVRELIKAAKDAIDGMDAGQYFGYMEKLLDRYAEDGSGEIVLSARDKKRITPEFKKALSKKKLKISDKTVDTESGFVLVYGDIEENCTIDALLETETERLGDAVSRYLFGEV